MPACTSTPPTEADCSSATSTAPGSPASSGRHPHPRPAQTRLAAVAAGLLAVRDPGDLHTLRHRADYLNADDDTDAGLPDLLGRSLRTTRRPDILKIAVTLKTLGRSGLGTLVDHVCAHAQEFADLVRAHPAFELYAPPPISTVLFRPAAVSDDTVAAVRRTLLHDGRAVLGRARLGGRLWLKATLLNPHTRPGDLAALLNLVEGSTPR